MAVGFLGLWRRAGVWAATLLMIVAVPVLAQDASARQQLALAHDTRSDLYRTPQGAVPAGTAVTLRLQASAGSLEAASVFIRQRATGQEVVLPMRVAATTPEGIDLWEAVADTGSQPGIDDYRFQVSTASATFYYEDDTRPDGFNLVESNKGGIGAAFDQSPGTPFQLTVYEPDFYTPEWMRNAVIYQIFPDRFRNGDPSNDPADGSDVFYGDLPLVFHETWNEPPIDGRTTRAPSGAGYYNSDFYGGDLAGIIDQLDYIQSLGVTAIYLNPIFEARSNHRYDTANYHAIDPLLGDLDTFRRLVDEADRRGIRLILDGVFNHLSSDSRFFDRYHRFPGDGACESLDSRWRSWFTFAPPKAGQPAPCVDTPDDATYYASWAGYDTIPRLNSGLVDVRRMVFLDQDSVARTWLNEGIGGWRLDVANEIDDGSSANIYWEAFRSVVRSVDLEAVIIGEEWHDASPWLTGDQWDSTMNYRFRRAILGFVRSDDLVDNDGVIPALSPSAFDAGIRAVEEDYPPMAYHALMNLLDSHDTTRLRFAVGGDLAAHKLAALAEFTLPGAPTVYYGDEVALDAPDVRDSSGVYQDDPYNRAPYSWPDTAGNHYPPPDADMLAFYQTLGAMRRQSSALRQGSMTTLVADDTQGVYAFVRIDAADAALVLLNQSDAPRTVTLNLQGLIPASLTLQPVFGPSDAPVDAQTTTVSIPATGGQVWLGSGEPAQFAHVNPPTGLTTQGSAGQVALTWDDSAEAAGYVIFRSPVANGGFEPFAMTPVRAASYVDTAISNGYRYYYAVAAVSADGLPGERSSAVVAAPFLTPDRIALVDTPPQQTLELTQSALATVTASIQIERVTNTADQGQGVLAQAALVAADQPSDSADWQAMTYVHDAGPADVYSARLAPSGIGTYTIAVRFSTDAGTTWLAPTFDDGSLPQLDVTASTDTAAPPAPADVTVERASLSGVALSWRPVDDASLAGYRVYRGNSGSDITAIADIPANSTRFVDQSVAENGAYVYAVSAFDSALNESARTETNSVTVERAMIDVVFRVEIPAGSSGDIYLAGNFGSTDYPAWDPAGIKMTPLDATHWAVTLNLSEGATVEYKFTRGAWEQVEKGSKCEELSNRRLVVVLGDEGMLTVSDVVANWRDIDCGG